ncbi:39S ribosomal protein L12-like protein, partial [Dinothrombium tinctorium]
HTRKHKWTQVSRTFSSAAPEAALQPPSPSNAPKQYSPKLHSIVDEISKLTLLEVSELNQLLKQTLNIPDVPMMQMSAASATAAAPAEEEVGEKVQTKTNYVLKMMKFDETKKVALIKEVKSLVEGMNLVQAKKFVETVPQIIKNNLTKEEAEALKKKLEELGASCVIE